MELQRHWLNYDNELEDCQEYITNVVTPFLQSVVDSITGKDVSREQKTAQVIVASLYR